MTPWVNRLALQAVLLGALGIAGCSDDNSNPAAPAPSTRVLVVHASPDAPAVDLLVDSVIKGSGLAYPGNTGYLSVTPGTRNVRVNASGTLTSVINANVDFASGTNTTIFAVDSLSKISAVVLADDLAAPAAGKAHVRFVHLSPNAPAVDVAVASGAVIFGNKTFKQSTAFTPLDAGTYDLEVRLAGTNTVVLPLPGIALTAGKIYTVFAKGFSGGSGAQALGAQIIVNN